MKTKNDVIYGDFQTSIRLTNKIIELLCSLDINPKTIIEPTCGLGSFITSAINGFPTINNIIALDINKNYIRDLSDSLNKVNINKYIICDDYFNHNWNLYKGTLEDPLLIIGNPPWVTTSELGYHNSTNRPLPSSERMNGFDALTGKSNFDLSEYIIRDLITRFDYLQDITIAMLCKTSVARKLLQFCWNNEKKYDFRIYAIDSRKEFGVNVDACLFLCIKSEKTFSKKCNYFQSLNSSEYRSISFSNGQLISDINRYNNLLENKNKIRIWRSGVKHDISNVLVLQKKGNLFVNGFNEVVDIENNILFPLLRGSDLANDRVVSNWIIVPNTHIKSNYHEIGIQAPKTIKYLHSKQYQINSRKSRVYKDNMILFGIGEYTFYPWKVAISSMYKKLAFKIVGPHINKPVLFDDTCYYLPCRDEIQAQYYYSLYNSQTALDFYESKIFWDKKRPITAELLNSLDINKIMIHENDSILNNNEIETLF